MTASSLDGPVDVDELLHLICLAAIDSVPGGKDPERSDGWQMPHCHRAPIGRPGLG